MLIQSGIVASCELMTQPEPTERPMAWYTDGVVGPNVLGPAAIR